MTSSDEQLVPVEQIAVDLAAHLAAAISLLKNGGKAAKKAAASDKMFDQMVRDYEACLERARARLAALRTPPAVEPDEGLVCGENGQLCSACDLPAHELTQTPGCGAPLRNTPSIRAQALEEAAWLPMKNAPHDGTHVLVLFKDESSGWPLVAQAFLNKAMPGFWWGFHFGKWAEAEALGWMHIPVYQDALKGSKP